MFMAFPRKRWFSGEVMKLTGVAGRGGKGMALSVRTQIAKPTEIIICNLKTPYL